ncbi:MAG: hypothetical protein M3Y59_21540 [Myxococcota bacterium]|nr:hypothetical protein [Myxococcota bacterium]
MSRNILGAALAVALSSLACSRAPSVQEVAETTAVAAEELSAEAGRSFDSAGKMSNLGALASLPVAPRAMPPEISTRLEPLLNPVRHPVVRSLSGGDDGTPNTPGEAWEAEGKKAAKFLRERVFTEDNLEEETSDALIFRVTGEDLCGDGTRPPEPSCVSHLDKYEIRLRAMRAVEGAGIDVTVLMGPDRLEPLRLELAPTRAALQLDVSEICDTYAYLAGVHDQTIDLPTHCEGKLELVAERHGEHDTSASVNILSNIEVTFARSSGFLPQSFRTQARSPAWRARSTGAERRITLDVDLGVTDTFWGPATYQVGSPLNGKLWRYHLGGASLSTSVVEGDSELLVTNLGAGDEQSYQALGDDKLYAYDLNPTTGRRITARIVTSPGQEPVVHLSPAVEVPVRITLAPMAADPALEVPAWALDESIQLSLTGGATGPALQRIPMDWSNPDEMPVRYTRVVAGTLRAIADEPGVEPLVVEAGQCLAESDDWDVDTARAHPLTRRYTAAACP